MSNVEVSFLDSRGEQEYTNFLENSNGALFYHSIKYRNFLRLILPRAKDIYLIARQNKKIVGALPAFIVGLDNGYSIINSLPFFGSHGGVVLSDKCSKGYDVKRLLIDSLFEVAKKESFLSLTIVDNPFQSHNSDYETIFNMSPSDYRISQVTDMSVTSFDNIHEELMNKFHSKTRNIVRKAQKGDFIIEKNSSLNAFKKLFEIHYDNMMANNGKFKPLFVFEAMHVIFEPEIDYNIYFAYKGTEVAAGLLVFYYKDYCEYFTPVIESKFRHEQPLSILIFKAMEDAILKNVKYWNWGGTWPKDQDGVYLFKSRWGTKESMYNYYTKIADENYIVSNKESIIDSTPFFYLYNFRK